MIARAAALALTLAPVLATPAAAQSPAPEIRSLAAGAVPAAVTLNDLKALVGDWAGPSASAGFSRAQNGQVVGHMALYADGKPRIQELWILRPESGSVTVRIKHFNPDLTAREDKDQWAERHVVATDASHIYLENLTFVTGKDQLDLYVRPGGGALLSWTMKRVR